MKLKLSFLFIVFVSFTFYSQQFTNSNLPIVIITTDINPDTGQLTEIPDDPKILASMKIISRPNGARNYLTDGNTTDFLNYNGRIKIEIKGSTSQLLDKKPYSLTTLQDDDISNNNVSILDMPSENDWILNALAFDSSLIRDYLSNSLSSNLGNYAPRGKYCEVVINGDYKGLYLLMEKIKIDSNRVNIQKMNPSDISTPNITGGYITKCDKTNGDPIAWTFNNTIGNDVYFIHDTPNPNTITAEQNNYIYNEFDSLETIMNVQNASITTGFPSKIDIPSFIDYMLLCELASNVDSYQFSTYFHKDRNGKLRAGPIWDFNLAYGLDVFGDRSQTNIWQFDNGDNIGASFWKNLYLNPIYKCYLSKRWNDITATNQPLNYYVIANQIDHLSEQLSESRIRENQRWNTIGNYNETISNLKTWIQIRINWMNSNLNFTSNCTFPTTPKIVISKINYNPVGFGANTSNDIEFIEITNNSSTTVSLTGFYFKELGVTYSFPANSSLLANSKLFLASNANSFYQEYGFVPFGVFTRNLSNKSQKLTLADAYGNAIDQVEYFDTNPWPIDADGNGAYLNLIDLNLDNNLASSWIATTSTLSNSFANSYENATTLYPNPATSNLTITNNQIAIKNYQLFDALGRLIIQKNDVNSNIETIAIENLAQNTYILKIVFDNNKLGIFKVLKK